MTKPEILVAHPGAAHFIYELVAAVAGLGYGARFETGFYWRDSGLPAALLAALPNGLREKLARELGRRHFSGIPNEAVTTRPFRELCYVAAARLMRSRPAVGAALLEWRNEGLDRAVAAGMRHHRPSLFIGHDTSALASVRAARAAGVPSVINQVIGHLAIGDRLLAEEAARHPDWADSMHAGAPRALIERCLAEVREADHILAPSDYVRETLIEVGVAPERIHLLPFGVRVDRFRPPERPRDDGVTRLLYVGQISQRKGLKYLLEAMRGLAGAKTELLLVGGMVGGGAGLAPYDGLYRHVPNVPHAEVQALFQSADIFVYPSLHEGSALAIFEAMATGLPVVTTLNSGSMARDGIEGFIVPPRDPEALAERINQLRTDAELRRKMGAAARARALEFTWDRYRDALGAILTNILG